MWNHQSMTLPISPHSCSSPMFTNRVIFGEGASSSFSDFHLSLKMKLAQLYSNRHQSRDSIITGHGRPSWHRRVLSSTKNLLRQLLNCFICLFVVPYRHITGTKYNQRIRYYLNVTIGIGYIIRLRDYLFLRTVLNRRKVLERTVSQGISH